MARTWRALGALLSYPTEELQAATGEIAAALGDEDIVPAPARAAIGALLDELADDRYLRTAGTLLRAVRSQPQPFAASVRARAWRKPRSRPGDGRSDRALCQPWAGSDGGRAARLPAAVPGIPVAAAGCRGARDAGRARRHPARTGRQAGRARHAAMPASWRCWPNSRRRRGWNARQSPTKTRTISPRSTRPGRKRRSASGPAR